MREIETQYIFVMKPDQSLEYMTLSAVKTKPKSYRKFLLPALKFAYFALS